MAARTRGSNRDNVQADVDTVDDVADGPVMSMMRNKERPREVPLGREAATVRFCSNYIMTAKYTPLTFLPKFLFEQFRRYANIFFLCIGLLQQIEGVSPTGRYVTIVPFTVILILTAIKELVEDVKRHRADRKTNSAKTLVFDVETKTFREKLWSEVVVGDVLRVENTKFFPADLVLLASSEPQGMCYIETSNLDGETNLKIRSAIQPTSHLKAEDNLDEFDGLLQCEQPNRMLYEFNGNIRLGSLGNMTHPLTPSSILLRGAKLMNTEWVHGVVIYTGHETKLLMNSTKAPLKRSNIDKITNSQIIFLFIILVVMSLASAIGSEVLKGNGENHNYVQGDDERGNFFFNFLTFVILYNNLIPISLQVTLEFVKFIQAYFINWDKDMYHEETDTFALARTSNLNEELGQIKYVFSDKTGTLTQNIMEFKECSVAGIKYNTVGTTSSSNTNAGVVNETNRGPDDIVQASDSEVTETLLLSNLLNNHDSADEIAKFLLIMGACHTVIPEVDEDDPSTLIYNASSPDEKALVEGAAMYGCKFLERKPDSVILRTTRGKKEEYTILNTIEFTSARKRMSVVMRCPDGKIRLMIKGADMMILDRLGQDPTTHRKHYDATLRHLEEFANTGLRTLCLATKDISQSEYDAWNAEFHEASIATSNREEKQEAVAAKLERDLVLLGATAIEDKLQDGVPETIANLLQANIKVWVLTGDKQETAINIGHACRLLSHEVGLIILNAPSLDQTREEIRQERENLPNLISEYQ